MKNFIKKEINAIFSSTANVESFISQISNNRDLVAMLVGYVLGSESYKKKSNQNETI